MGTTKAPKKAHAGVNRNTSHSTADGIGRSSAKGGLTMASQTRSGYYAPAARPLSDISRSKEKRIPTTPLVRPTSKNAKKLTCGSRFGVLVSFAFSGMNRAVSALFVISRSPGLRDGACTIASLAPWVARPARRTVSCFIPSAMTEFISYVFLYPNRVSFQEAFEALEPDDGKLSRPVLRGPGLSNGVRLLDLSRRVKARIFRLIGSRMTIGRQPFQASALRLLFAIRESRM